MRLQNGHETTIICSFKQKLNTMVLSENQRIKSQIGEKDCHLPSGKEKWNLLWRKNVEDLLDFLQQIRQNKMRQQGRLQENDNLFFG